MVKQSATLLFALATFAFAADLYVDDQSYYIDWTGGWAYLQPDVEWRFADGTDWDTTGAGEYRNYGSVALGTELTDVNQPGLTEGFVAPHQSALAFDGVNDYLQLAGATSELQPGISDFSVMVWLRVLATGDEENVIGKYDTGNNKEWNVYIRNNSYLVVLCQDGLNVSNQEMRIQVNPTYNDNIWHCFAFTWISDDLRFFVDGAEVTDTTVVRDNGITQIYVGTAIPTIGILVDSGAPIAGTFFSGNIAWVGYWESGLTVAQVDSLYDEMAGLGTTAKPFVSLQSAVYQSSASDRLLIEAGTYRETVVSATNALTFTAADSSSGNRPVLLGDSFTGSPVGMTITPATTVSYLTVRGYGSQGIRFTPSASVRLVVSHCEFDSSGTNLSLAGSAGSSDFEIVNSVFDRLNIGVNAFSNIDSVYVINSIFTNFSSVGISRTAGTVVYSYCDFFGNTADVSGVVVDGGNNLTINPRYTGGNNYRPRKWSLVLMRGDPDVARYMGAWNITYSPRAEAGDKWARGAWGRSAWGR